MLDLVKSFIVLVIMVPVLTVIMLSLIYILGKVLTLISQLGYNDHD